MFFFVVVFSLALKLKRFSVLIFSFRWIDSFQDLFQGMSQMVLHDFNVHEKPVCFSHSMRALCVAKRFIACLTKCEFYVRFVAADADAVAAADASGAVATELVQLELRHIYSCGVHMMCVSGNTSFRTVCNYTFYALKCRYGKRK